MYVIDGYNIIKSPQATRSVKKNTRVSHQAFLSSIRSRRLTGSVKNRVIVVFDGFPPVNTSLSDESLGIEVVFSGSLSADERIQRLVDKAANPKNLIVVTDDRQVQFSARAAGARVMGAEGFLKVKSEKEKVKNTEAVREKQAEKAPLPFSQQEKINRELRKLWLE